MSEARAELERLLGADRVGAWRDPRRGEAEELPLAAPASVEALAEVVRWADASGRALLPVGLGSKLSWCHPPRRVDLVLSTRDLRGVPSHEPGDGTLSALAGTTLAELRAVAAGGGHWLTPDVPAPAHGTLGGALAAGQSGCDRTRFGPLRHHVLGLRVVGAAGSIARSGGQLVKNVTGYDLHRLHCGACGTLGVVVEAALRLFPLPEHRVEARWTLERVEDGLELARGLRALSFTPLSLALWSEAGTWCLAAHLGGREAAVEAELVDLERTAPGAVLLRGAEAVAAHEASRDAELRDGSWPDLHVAVRPSRVRQVLELAARAASEMGLAAPLVRAHPAVATVDLRLGDPDRADGLAELTRALRTALEPDGGRVHLRGAQRCGLDPFGSIPAGLELMRGLRAALDPRGTFAPGALAQSL